MSVIIDAIAKVPLAEVPWREPVRVHTDTRLGDVVTTMRNQHQGSALVCERDALVGIFTEHDLLRRVPHGDLGWRDRPVRDVMTARPMIIREDDTLAEALRRMDVGKHRHLPVVRGRTPIGILSIRDLLAHIARKFPADFINLPPSPDREARGPWGG